MDVSLPTAPGAHAFATDYPRFPIMPVNRITNRRAAAHATNTTIPKNAYGASDFMALRGFTEARLIGAGGFGKAFVVDAATSSNALRTLYADLGNRIGTLQTLPPYVVLKIVEPRFKDPWTWSSAELERVYVKAYGRQGVGTSHVEREIASRDPVRIAKIAAWRDEQRLKLWSKIVHAGAAEATNLDYVMDTDAAPYAPALYFAGTYRQAGVYVIAMEYIPGRSLFEVGKEKRGIPVDVLAKLEKTCITLASAGIEHADAHFGNFVVTPSGEVRVLDFGMSVILPSSVQKHIATNATAAVDRLCRSGNWPSHDGIWAGMGSITRYMNSYMYEVHRYDMRNGMMRWYTNTGKMLQYARTKKLGSINDLNAARKLVWQCLARPGPVRRRRWWPLWQ